ncbi:MAG: zf-HC2 domain-containing protein [Clostridia bacterium]|nr:zf-HC2 domain-containing protein [Clostridia bacterium]
MSERCDVVRDLIPLCLDGAAAKGSEKMVQEHIEKCEGCAGYYEAMQKALPKMNEAEEKAEKAAFDSMARDMQRKKRCSTAKKVLLGIVIGFAAIWALLFGYSKLAQKQVALDTDAYNVYLSQLEDGRVVCTADYEGSSIITYMDILEKKDENEKRNMYFVLKTNYIRQYAQNPMQNGHFMVMDKEDFETMDAYYVGQEGNRLLIWQRGDAIPKASAEMEKYFFFDDLRREIFETRFKETSDGKAYATSYSEQMAYRVLVEQCQLAAQKVPEWQPVIHKWNSQYDDTTVEWVLEQLTLEEENLLTENME